MHKATVSATPSFDGKWVGRLKTGAAVPMSFHFATADFDRQRPERSGREAAFARGGFDRTRRSKKRRSTNLTALGSALSRHRTHAPKKIFNLKNRFGPQAHPFQSRGSLALRLDRRHPAHIRRRQPSLWAARQFTGPDTLRELTFFSDQIIASRTLAESP